MLVRDGWRLARATTAALRHAVVPPVPHPSLAALEGDPVARPGHPNVYRIRLYNPTAATHAVRLVLRGWRGAGAPPAFEVAADLTLAAGAVVERWLDTTWERGATLGERAGADGAPWQPDAAPASTAERWLIEARLEAGGRELERLRIGGVLA